MILYSPAGAVDAPGGPSFDCKRATSQVNQLICGSAELSALDRKLATDYDNTLHQGNVDGKQLQSDELQWLHEVRNRCATVECLNTAYTARDEAILERSLRAASPAQYDDRKPFPAPDHALATARALIGKSCDAGPAQPLPGTSRIKGFQMIVALGGYLVPLNVAGYPFVFWLEKTDPASAACTVSDVVALPPPSSGDVFLQCHVGSDSHGFAVRTSDRRTLAYWSISGEPAKIERQPIHVLGEQDLRCQAPETGE